MDSDYGVKDIQVLEGLEAVRFRSCKKKTWYVYWYYRCERITSFSMGNSR